MRRALRKEGVGYMVVRKTLAKIALKEAGIAGTMPEFVGELALVGLELQLEIGRAAAQQRIGCAYAQRIGLAARLQGAEGAAQAVFGA